MRATSCTWLEGSELQNCSLNGETWAITGPLVALRPCPESEPCNSAIVLPATKQSRQIAYTLISDIDIQSRLGNVTDSDSVTLTTSDLQKEAEIFLSSIVLNMPEKGIGVSPQDWFDRVDQNPPVFATPNIPLERRTHATLPTRATLGQARRGHASRSQFAQYLKILLLCNYCGIRVLGGVCNLSYPPLAGGGE
jgi:hypothetical protein